MLGKCWSRDPPIDPQFGNRTGAENIIHHHRGPTAAADEAFTSQLLAFAYFLTDPIVERIVHYTNLHKEQYNDAQFFKLNFEA